MSQFIYLDHAATTPVDERVFAVMNPYLTEQYYNPSAQYLAAKAVRRDIDDARATVAHWLGCRPIEVTFTAGGSEANNLAIAGIMSAYPNGNIIVSAVEHDSILKPAGEYDCRVVPVKPDGVVDIEKLMSLIDEKTVVVSVMYANNEIGTVQPIKEIAQRLADVRQRRTDKRPLYFHTDACQAGAYLDLHISRLGVDMMTLNASKIYGPKQTGALYVRTGITLKPIILGGGQERGNRSGTENVAGIVGFAKALELVQTDRQGETRRLHELQRLFVDLLTQEVPDVVINGSMKHRLPNNIHATFLGIDNERLMMQLDEAGVLVAAGSACSASSEEPSHVLTAIGLTDDEARSSLRITMGHSTDEVAVRRTVELLRQFTRN